MHTALLYSGFAGHGTKEKHFMFMHFQSYLYKSKFVFTSRCNWKLKLSYFVYYVTLSKGGSYKVFMIFI